MNTGVVTITSNTHSIHHYTASWFTKWDKRILRIERCRNRDGIEYKMRRAVSFPFRLISKIDKMGLKKTIKFAVRKMKGN